MVTKRNILIDDIVDRPRIALPVDFNILLRSIKIFPGLQHHQLIVRYNTNNSASITYNIHSTQNNSNFKLTIDPNTGKITFTNDLENPSTNITDSIYNGVVSQYLNTLVNDNEFSESNTFKVIEVKASEKKREEYTINN